MELVRNVREFREKPRLVKSGWYCICKEILAP